MLSMVEERKVRVVKIGHTKVLEWFEEPCSWDLEGMRCTIESHGRRSTLTQLTYEMYIKRFVHKETEYQIT